MVAGKAEQNQVDQHPAVLGPRFEAPPRHPPRGSLQRVGRGGQVVHGKGPPGELVHRLPQIASDLRERRTQPFGLHQRAVDGVAEGHFVQRSAKIEKACHRVRGIVRVAFLCVPNSALRRRKRQIGEL
jgi:hypothetical protein